MHHVEVGRGSVEQTGVIPPSIFQKLFAGFQSFSAQGPDRKQGSRNGFSRELWVDLREDWTKFRSVGQAPYYDRQIFQ